MGEQGKPPVEYQFKKGHPKLPNAGKKKGYCSPDAEIRKLLNKKIAYEDPTTKKPINGKIGQAIAIRQIYNALEGDQKALEYVIDRMDGKMAQKVLNEMSGEVKMMGRIKIDGKEWEPKVGS